MIRPMFLGTRPPASAAYDPVQKRHLVVFGLDEADLYGQFIDGDGAVVGDAFLIAATEYAALPVVSYDPVNNVFFVAWNEFLQVYGQLLSPAGTPLGERLLVLSFGDANEHPRIAANTNNGGFLVTWPTSRGHGGQLIGIGR